MQRFKRLFSAFLACAIMLGMVAAPIPAEAATTDYELVFLDEIKKLTPGTDFDPATAETVTSANKGDIVVLTVAFNNKASATTFNSFSASTNYDSTRLTPYVGAAPFSEPSTYFAGASNAPDGPDLSGWMIASNAATEGKVNVSGMSMSPANAATGETVLGYMAFEVKSDAADGQAQFTFDEKASVGSLALSDFNPLTLTIGAGGSSTDPDPTNPTNPADDEPETPSHVTDYELVFLEDIKKLTPGATFDPATAETVTSANAGDIVVLTVAFNNKSSATTFNSFSLPTNYDSTRLTPYVGAAPFSEPSTYFAGASNAPDGPDFSGWMIASNAATAGKVNVSGMSMTAANVPAGETALGYMAFQVNADAPDGQAAFKFDDAATVGSLDLTSFLSRKLWIGEPPSEAEVDSVSVTATPSALTVPDAEAEAVTASFTAQAKDQSGNVMTGQTFTWTWDGDGKFEGVTFQDATETTPATVAVAPGAAVTQNETVTVTATSGGKSGSATLTIYPVGGGPSDTPLTATVTDPNNNNQPVTTVTKNGATQTFQASVSGDAAVTWTATTADGTPVTVETDGIGVDSNGTVTVTDSATAGTYYIVATPESGDPARASLTVTEGGETPSVTLDHVTLNPATITLDGATGQQSAASAFALGENDEAVSVTTGVTWSVEPAGQGVVIDAAGLITILATATPDSYEITATYNNDSENTAKATLTVQRSASADAVLDHITLTPAAVKVEGSAEAQAATSTAAAFALDEEGEPVPITTGVTWSIEPADKGVTISPAGEITVPATTAAPSEFTVTGTHNNISKTAKLTVTADEEVMSISSDRASIEIPGINAANNTESATFTAVDINTGNKITSGLTWTIADRDTGESVEGVTINPETGTVTVDKTARFQITDTPDASGLTGKTMIVTATREDGKSATAPIIVRRADAFLAIVTLSLDGQSASTGGEALDIVSDGSSVKSVSAVAQDQYGENVEGAVTWELESGGNGLNLSGSGVSVSGSNYQAYVTIGTTAKHGTYIVKATQDNAPAPVSARMTISRGDEIVSDLTLSDGQNEIEIPGKDDPDNRANAFKALVKNQYREDMPDAEVLWTITDASGLEVPGLTIENGVVTVAYAAKEAVTDTVGRYFTVSATAGELQPRTAQILVKRAAPYLNSITLNQQDSSQNVTVSIDGGEDVAVQGEAWDQYESPIAAQTWSVSSLGFGSGVTADSATGVISVSKDATPGNYSVSASLNGRTVGPNLMIVSRGTPVPTRVLISGGQASVTIPGDGQSPAPAAQSYTAIVKDQFNSDMADQTVSWTITDESGALVSGISIENGVVIVANEAKSFIPAGTWKIMKVRAACGSITSEPADIYVRRADSVLTQVRIESPLVENDITVIEYDGAGEQTVPATALDQYGETFSGASWELTSYNTSGVNVSQTGTIIINSSAVDGVVHTLTAKYGAQSPSAAFRIKKVASGGVTLTSVTVTPTTVGIPSGAQAAALNGDGQEIRYGITWSAYPEGQGVSVGGDGRIYVSTEAKADNYVILAQPDGVSVLGTPKSATLTVENAAPPTVTLNRVELLQDTLTVNGTSGAGTQAIAYDAKNSPILSGVTWSISPKNGEVTIDSASGEITVSRSATDGSYTVTGTKDGVSHTATLTVRNETPVTLANVMLNPATVTVDGTNGETSTARAVDANNQTLTSGVTWSVSPENKGVEVSESGAITVAASTETGNYDITAAYGGASKSATLRVNKSDAPAEPVTLVSVTLSANSVTVDGETAQSATATANGSNGQPITTGVTWSVTPDGQGVEIGESGAISIAANAPTGDYTVNAAHNGANQSATLHVTNNAPVPVTQDYAVTVTPAAVTVNGASAQTAQASATTSDNAPVTGGLVWSVAPAGNGVSIDAASGKIAVSATAAGLTYTVTATRGAESHSATLTVTNNTPPTLSSVSLNPAAIALNGEAATSSAAAISSADAPLTSGVTWSVRPENQGVSINATSGEISVAATALAGTYTVSAAYQATTRSAALTVTGGADVEYEAAPVDATEFANTPLNIPYGSTGVNSSDDQAKVKTAALAVPQVKQAVETPAAGTETEVRVTTEIKLKSYQPFIVSVTPMYEVIQKSGDTETTLYKEPLSELSEPVTVSLNVPADCDAAFAKHEHNGVTYYEPISYGGTAANPVASWTQQYFSDVELTKEAVTITFNPNGVTTTGVAVAGATVTPTTKTVTLGGKLDSLPTPVAPVVAGYVFTFDNWYLDNELADLNTVFTKAETLVAHWTSVYTGGGGSGGGGGGGGGGSSGGSSSGGSSSGGSSSGGGSSKVEYNITLSSGSGGNLSASAKKAVYGTAITVVPAPNAGYELNTLTIQTRAGKDVEFSTSGGTYSFEMPRTSVTVTATFERTASSNAGTDTGNAGNSSGNNSGNSSNSGNTTPAPSYSSISFVDMPPDNFFYTAVRWAVERGITNGTTATTFSPNQACTRAQMVMFLWRSQGMPMPSSSYSPFVDADPSANYYTAMLWAIERGITNGTTATTFEPYAACTRAQMVMFLHRVAGRPMPTQTTCPFTDITVGENYYVPMLWALERGITNGTTATTFSPYQACTRAQMVMFLYRYLGGV